MQGDSLFVTRRWSARANLSLAKAQAPAVQSQRQGVPRYQCCLHITVAAALLHARAPLTVDQLATALGWPMDRVRSALHDAEHYPDLTDPVTLQLPAPNTYTTTTRLDRLSAPQRQALSAASGSREAVG